MANRGADRLRLTKLFGPERSWPPKTTFSPPPLAPHLANRRGRLVFTTTDTSGDWIRTLLTTLSDQLKLQAMPEQQMAVVEKVR